MATTSKRYGSETPRLWTKPLRELTRETTLGFEAIEFAEDILGVKLLPWQRWFLIHALELLPNGKFRFRTVILTVARQNGKSTLASILILYRMYVDRARLIIGAAQNLDTAEETWQGALDMVESVPELEALKGAVNRAKGKREFALRTGERYKIASPKRGAGRGLSADMVLMDELREHTSWETWGSLANTTMARPRGMTVGVSNAGDYRSVVLKHWRDNAIVEIGQGKSLGVFEWSAPEDCDLDDRDAWAQANPGLGYTILEETLEAARGQSESMFRTENLCQWVAVDAEGPFGSGTWGAVLDEESKGGDGRSVIAVDVSHDRSFAYLAAARLRDDGLAHVEVFAKRPGTEWLLPALKKNMAAWGVDSVALQGRGAPASALAELFESEGIRVERVEGPDLGAAYGHLYDSVVNGKLRHRTQPDLDLAANSAVTKPLGETWVVDRMRSPVDAAPLCAVAFALWFLTGKTVRQVESAYSNMTSNWWE